MPVVLGLILAAAGVAATIWAGLRSTRAKRAAISVDLAQSIALPPAATDPLNFYSIAVRNTGVVAVTFPSGIALAAISETKSNGRD